MNYSPDIMENETGIDPELIREVARLYANTNKGIIFWGMGISQHTHGTDNAKMFNFFSFNESLKSISFFS